ncbi:MAG: molybdopterin-binding protein [Desulfobacterales bacterium]
MLKLSAAAAPVLEIRAYRRMRFGAVVTGSELHAGLVTDEFDRYVGQKAQDYGCTYVRKIIVPDEPERIAAALRALVDLGCELIIFGAGHMAPPSPKLSSCWPSRSRWSTTGRSYPTAGGCPGPTRW